MTHETGLSAAVILAFSVIWVGCGTTRVVHVQPSDADVFESINRRARTDRVTVILHSDPVETFPSARLFAIDPDSVHFADRRGRVHSNPMSIIDEMIFGRKISMTWPGVGALAGGILSGLIYVRTRDRGGDVIISDGETFALGFAGGVIPGAVFGGIISAVLGSPRTVYRFNPDSPDQVSLVIGARPTSSTNNLIE